MLVALLALMMFTLSACASNGIGEPRQQDEAQQNPAATEATEDNGSNDDAASGDSADDGGSGDDSADDGAGSSGGGASDGAGNEVYAVGDAGEVELRVEDGGLVLVEVRPNEGWDFEIDDEERDEIDIDFRRGNEEWEFEVELDDGELEVEIDRDIDD